MARRAILLKCAPRNAKSVDFVLFFKKKYIHIDTFEFSFIHCLVVWLENQEPKNLEVYWDWVMKHVDVYRVHSSIKVKNREINFNHVFQSTTDFGLTMKALRGKSPCSVL